MHPLGAHEALLCSADVVIALDKESMKAVVSKVTDGRGPYAGIDPVAGGMTGQVRGKFHEGFLQPSVCLPRWLSVLLRAWCVHSHTEEGRRSWWCNLCLNLMNGCRC